MLVIPVLGALTVPILVTASLAGILSLAAVLLYWVAGRPRYRRGSIDA